MGIPISNKINSLLRSPQIWGEQIQPKVYMFAEIQQTCLLPSATLRERCRGFEGVVKNKLLTFSTTKGQLVVIKK